MWSLLSLTLHLHIPCHPLMLSLQTDFPELSRCVHTGTQDIPPQQLCVKGSAESYQNRQEGNDPSQEARWWGITSGGDEGPPLSPRGMPANGNHISALLSSISVTYINTQTGWKTIATLEWTFGAMQTITTITFFGGQRWWKCLIIYVRFPFCFVFT